MPFHRSWMAVPLAVATVLCATPARGQEVPDSVRAELARLRARVDSLEAVVRRLLEQGREGEAADALSRLRAAAAEAAAGGVGPDSSAAPAAAPVFASRQRSLQALNPEISVNADLLGHVDFDEPGRDNFVAREFEFSFQSALDPFSRAKIYLTHHSHGPELVPFEAEHAVEDGHVEDVPGHEEEGGVEVEEGFVEWVGLPGGVGLKLGKFFQRFGAMNRWHGHALPFQSRSLPHQVFLGEESLAQAGASVSWLIPVHGLGAYDATVEVTRSSNEALFGEADNLSYLAHLNGFWQLGEASDLDLGVSWLRGDYEDELTSRARTLVGVEAAYTWAPPARARHRGLVLRAGAMILDGLVPPEGIDPEGGAAGEAPAERAVGLWSLAELRLSQQWLVGGRLDRVENPLHPEETAWLGSATLTWWQSEFVRLRLEYDLLGRSFLDENDGRLWLQATFAMGPHKHENY